MVHPQTVHEGTDTVKQIKLQNLNIAFETLTMKDTEAFNEFYVRLSDIVNSSLNLGEPISKVRIVKKVLQYLPERFRPKVVAIEEYQNMDSLAVEDLVGNLQTFETSHCSTKKGKDIALMSSKSVEDDSDVELDSKSDDLEFEAFFVKKLWKNMKNNLKKDFQNNKAPNKSKFVPKFDKDPVKGSSKPIQCFEYQGCDHTAAKCAKKKERK